MRNCCLNRRLTYVSVYSLALWISVPFKKKSFFSCVDLRFCCWKVKVFVFFRFIFRSHFSLYLWIWFWRPAALADSNTKSSAKNKQLSSVKKIFFSLLIISSDFYITFIKKLVNLKIMFIPLYFFSLPLKTNHNLQQEGGANFQST